MPINTKAVQDRRSLSFSSPNDIRADLTLLEAGAASGTIRHTGNWTPGQIFTHLAAFINYGYDGYPSKIANPPWLLRTLGKMLKTRTLAKKGSAGMRIPGVKEGTFGAEDVATAEGLTRLRAALSRLDAAPPSKPNPLFGPLTFDEWKQLHTRHAELHLSFVHPS